jgi:hypothetical protein
MLTTMREMKSATMRLAIGVRCPITAARAVRPKLPAKTQPPQLTPSEDVSEARPKRPETILSRTRGGV